MSVSGAALQPARRGLARVRELVPTPSGDDRVIAQRARAVAICLGAIVVAYHYSLSTLMRTLNVDTPLAYLGLVPLIALALAAFLARPAVTEPVVYDRQIDYIVGLPLLGMSLVINILLPVRLSTMFWVWRVDLLGLPLFVAGCICLLFGVRTLWRLRLPVVFLLFAWPLPYTELLLRELQSFTNATLSGVRLALHVVPVAHALPSGDGSLFQVEHGGGGFPVSIASACSGVNGVVGYVLLGAALLVIVKGPLTRKLAWLVLGMAITWVLNVVRIMLIFGGGNLWGRGVALDALHPFLGLVTFGLGFLVMLLMLGRFGLRLPRRPPAPSASDRAREARPMPTRVAAIVVVAAGLASGFANTTLRSFDLVSNAIGEPRLVAFLTHPAAPTGWRASKYAQYDWARQYFGDSSNWYRYQYTWNGRTATPLHSDSGVIADVVSTSDLSSFSTYGIEACYRFHGYKLKSTKTVDIGDGITAGVVAYHNAGLHSDWTSLYWIVPVRTPEGGKRYERIVLMMSDASKVDGSVPVPSSSVARSLGLKLDGALSGRGGATNSHVAKTERFLVAFAAALVRAQPRSAA